MSEDPPSRAEQARAQEQRAIETINAIVAGGDLSKETLDLSNEFTDRQTARLTSWLRGKKP
jgi:hypothetical protein